MKNSHLSKESALNTLTESTHTNSVHLIRFVKPYISSLPKLFFFRLFKLGNICFASMCSSKLLIYALLWIIANFCLQYRIVFDFWEGKIYSRSVHFTPDDFKMMFVPLLKEGGWIQISLSGSRITSFLECPLFRWSMLLEVFSILSFSSQFF